MKPVGDWKLVYWHNANEVSPIYEFIEGLEEKSQARVYKSLDMLEKYGLNLGYPHIKKLKGYDLWELRILGGDNIRIFYITMKEKKFLLLHGFVKKKQKTDIKEIKIALKRLTNITKL